MSGSRATSEGARFVGRWPDLGSPRGGAAGDGLIRGGDTLARRGGDGRAWNVQWELENPVWGLVWAKGGRRGELGGELKLYTEMAGRAAVMCWICRPAGAFIDRAGRGWKRG